MPEYQVNFSVEMPIDSEKQEILKRQNPFRAPTIAQVLAWIETRNLDEPTKVEVIKVAKGYPNGALWQFQKNFAHHLKKIRSKKLS